MTDATATQLTARPEEVAALRARLLAAAATDEQRPETASLCPTVKRLLESKRKERQLSA